MRIRKRTKRKLRKLFILILLVSILYGINYYDSSIFKRLKSFAMPSYSLNEIPEYTDRPYVYINNNNPDFKEEDKHKKFEKYSNLDLLGRCGPAYANLHKSMMPTKERDYIGMIKPSGWQIEKYDFIEGRYLYNRCHLIAYQFTGQNANPKNLITCTRTTNSVTMLEFENMVGNYLRKTGNHVLYRVTPIFKGTNLIASGIQMEALSVEDNGLGIKFNVYIYNRENKVVINYQTGKSHLEQGNKNE